ncbi:MAG: hypothetical protein KAJ75_06920 [Alphaproteobacteria bacterium]|nr:hypothetical protein [Alphaproteobacteria bacterium]
MTKLTQDEITKQESAQVSKLATAGVVVEVDPDTADEMGAFEETALTAEDAEDARFDNKEELTNGEV